MINTFMTIRPMHPVEMDKVRSAVLSDKSAQASEAWRSCILRGDKRVPLSDSSGAV